MKSILLLSLIIINTLSYQPANNNKNKFDSAPPPHAQNNKPKPTNIPSTPHPTPISVMTPTPTPTPSVSLPTAEPSFPPIFKINPPVDPIPLKYSKSTNLISTTTLQTSDIGLKE